MAKQEVKMKTISFGELGKLIQAINQVMDMSVIIQDGRSYSYAEIQNLDIKEFTLPSQKILEKMNSEAQTEISQIKQNPLIKDHNIEFDRTSQNIARQKDDFYNKQYSQPAIIFKNLTIEVSADEEVKAFYNRKINSKSIPEGYWLICENVTFKNFAPENKIPCVNIKTSSSAFIKIESCKFENVSLRLNAIEMRHGILIAKNSSFNSLDIISSLDDESKKLDIENDYFIYMFKNKMHELLFANENGVPYKLIFSGGNEINRIYTMGKNIDVQTWSKREKIIVPKNSTAIELNKKTLMLFRENAKKSGNRLNELLFQHHINECDEALINLKDEGYKWQDKMIMLIGKFLSNHGTSWLRPLVIMGIVNIITVIIVCLAIDPTSFKFFLLISGELLHPLSTLGGIIGKIEPKISVNYAFMAYLTGLHKFIYAICAYEFVRAARRFTAR